MRHKHHTGLSRLLPYAAERKGQMALIALLAALSAAAPVAGWLLVEDATNNGIRAGDDDRLVLAVLAYVGVNAAAWVLGTLTWLGLASVGQRIVLELRRDLFQHLTSLSLRYFSQQKAGWIISRLNSDVDALSDVLNQGLTTLVVAGADAVVGRVLDEQPAGDRRGGGERGEDRDQDHLPLALGGVGKQARQAGVVLMRQRTRPRRGR
ncbi:MAG TPA: ABC transporter transmembrane domain-containing protein [Gaiellaceae bacterium]|nr:ABC transporter transmembrane domain-containing protein [Gaiellaceae bacterium]